jgi:tRNA threonylcarbamoyladenosine biosynthesis protein TsaE
MPLHQPGKPKPRRPATPSVPETHKGARTVGKPWRLVLRTPQQTHRLGQCVGALLRGGEVIALFGELGTGKTSLVRGMADGLLADSAAVSSPTFTLIHEYRGRLPLIHTDLYRLTASQLDDTGLGDYLDGHTVVAIEWADRWREGLPADRLEVCLAHRLPAARQAILTATGPSSARLLTELRTSLSRPRPTRVVRQTRVQSSRPRRASH